MFCRKCGKEIGNSNFCSECGEPVNCNSVQGQNEKLNEMLFALTEKVKTIGYEKLLKVVCALSTVINLIIRITNNSITVVYSALASDDYFCISEEGKQWTLIVLAIEIILTILLWLGAKKDKMPITKKGIIFVAVMLVIQLAIAFINVPAPY